jgi:hypothetical protein
MIDRPSSVFAKLVAVMLTMAASLLLLVGGFFWFIVSPVVSTSIDRVLEEHARTIAATSPDVETARSLGARLGFQVRYEGPAGSWSTVSGLPAIDDVQHLGLRGWAPFSTDSTITWHADRMVVPTSSPGMFPGPCKACMSPC